MKKYIIALDQGTTSSRAVAFDRNANVAGIRNVEFHQIFPKPGWVEHDPYDILNSQLSAFNKLLSDFNILPEEIDSIGITNQRETVVVWNRLTGKPIYNAIVWQCRRTASICEELKKNNLIEYIKSSTGLVPDAYFSGTKIKWILDNVEGARKLAKENQLMAGTVDSWLLYNLTEQDVHVTDVTNASRTMLFNIKKGEWDSYLLDNLDIPHGILPEVKECSGHFGNLNLKGTEIPICGCAGDQQAALFGQLCHNPGDAKNTYGTGCFILMNTGDIPVISENGLLTTIAWKINGNTTYALEGSVFNAGSCIQWLRDQLGLIKEAKESEECALKVEDTADVFFIPAFTGLGAPYWDMYARGTILGITRGTNKNHIVRAALEAIAYMSDDVLTSMMKDSNLVIKDLRVDGGASVNNFLMQFQSDILGINVTRPVINETTSLGAAFLSGLHTGFFDNFNKLYHIDRVYSPSKDKVYRENARTRWKDAVSRSKNWAAK